MKVTVGKNFTVISVTVKGLVTERKLVGLCREVKKNRNVGKGQEQLVHRRRSYMTKKNIKRCSISHTLILDSFSIHRDDISNNLTFGVCILIAAKHII